MARPPVTPVVVYPTGAYEAVRRSPKDGACGIHAYPCVHPGEDLRAPKGTPVAAPHDGWILVSKATEKAPFSGYGPAVVLLAHDDSTDPWYEDLARYLRSRVDPVLPLKEHNALRYSLLAHLDPTSLTYNQDLTGEALSRDNYDIEDATNIPPSWTGGDVPAAPQWVMSWTPPIYVHEGEVLGYIGDAGHVHWEIRVAPFGTHGEGATMDPFLWLSHYDTLTAWGTEHLPVDTSKNPRGPKAGSSSWWLWLLLIVAIAKGRRR